MKEIKRILRVFLSSYINSLKDLNENSIFIGNCSTSKVTTEEIEKFFKEFSQSQRKSTAGKLLNLFQKITKNAKPA